MVEGQRLRYALFTTVYFVEGALLTFFSGFNALYLRSFDVSYTRIGIVGGITLIPFVLKLFVGLLSDRVPLLGLGHRKPYIVIGLAMQAVASLVAAFVSPAEGFTLYVVLILLTSLGMSTYDTASDGLSVDTTPEAERGLVQGLMVGGRALAGVIGALVMGALSQAGQWWAIFLILGALALLTIPLALAVKDPGAAARGKALPQRGAFRAFLDAGFILFLILGLLYPFALYSANGMIGTFLNEVLGIGLARVGIYTSVFGLGTIAGGVLGGLFVKRVGQQRGIVLALLITAVATLGLAVVPSAAIAWAVVALFGIAFGYYETVYMAMGMDFCDPRIAAFMFAFVMAVCNIGIGAGQPVAGLLVDKAGFRTMFLVFAAVHIASLPVVWGVFKLRKPKSAGEGAPA